MEVNDYSYGGFNDYRDLVLLNGLWYSPHMRTKAVIAVVFCCIPTISVVAEQESRVSLGDFLLNRSPMTAPSSSLNYSAASEVDFDEAPGSFSYGRADLNIPLAAPFYLNDCNTFLFSADYTATWLDSDTLIGSKDLNDFRFNIRWLFKEPGSNWGWTALLSPGIASDGRGISGDDLSINGSVGFRYSKSAHFAWLGGVVFFHNSMESRVFPAIGFQWQPVDNMIIRFSGPSLKASWQPSDKWILHAGVSSGGGTWNVEDAGASYDVRLRSYQAGVGVERRLSEKVWLGLWGGATIANELKIETASGNRLFKQDGEPGWFLKLGIRRIVW